MVGPTSGSEEGGAMNRITVFSGPHHFLSNFHLCSILYEGITYASTEHAYQAAKCASPFMRLQFVGITATEAKRAGRRVKMRPDWEQVKLGVMLDLLRIKFAVADQVHHATILDALLATGDAELIEGNWWHDQYWGVCNCGRDGTCAKKGGVGENCLGKLLMQVRDERRKELTCSTS